MYTYLHNSYNIRFIWKWGPHTVTGGCDARRQCSNGNVCPIHTTIDTSIEQRNCKWWSEQVWYADDSYAVGSLTGVKKWWEYLQANGPDFGHCPKPAKTILLIKYSSQMQAAQKIFKRWWNQNHRPRWMPPWISNWDRIIQGTIH